MSDFDFGPYRPLMPEEPKPYAWIKGLGKFLLCGLVGTVILSMVLLRLFGIPRGNVAQFNTHVKDAEFNKKFNRGLACYNNQDYDNAIADYTDALAFDPHNSNARYAYHNRGLAHVQKGHYDKAIADYSEAIRLDRMNSDSYYERGRTYHVKKDYNKAIADYSEAININPDKDAYRGRGIAYDEKKEYDKAIADFSEAIRLEPENLNGFEYNVNLAWAFYGRGRAYNAKEVYEKALADYTNAIRHNPILEHELRAPIESIKIYLNNSKK